MSQNRSGAKKRVDSGVRRLTRDSLQDAHGTARRSRDTELTYGLNTVEGPAVKRPPRHTRRNAHAKRQGLGGSLDQDPEVGWALWTAW